MKQLTINILTLFFVISFSAIAQKGSNQKIPKVGLVLSGGGAKGMAHIGVLKVIDSLGIQIDYIAGTSMGAFIGGLYASGYSGKQLDSIFKNIDFDKIINDDMPRAAKAFYERNNSEKYALNLPFNKFKISLPSALSRGQNVFNTLSRLTLHVSSINDFNKLPIPFFCVSTNIENGQQVILNKGNLPLSLMASGALPSLYQPVTINDTLLVDGGVINNYPVNELRQKGIDIIIGVDVQDELAPKEEIISATDVLKQINNFRTAESMDAKIKNTDIYIKPKIKDYSVVSFNNRTEITTLGKQAALENINKLNELPLKPNHKYKQLLFLKPKDSITINTFTFNGKTNYSREYVLGKLKINPNEKICCQDLNDGVDNLIATNNFDSFQYQLKPTGDSNEYNFQGELIESKNKRFLKLGLHYDDLYKSAALINLTQKQFIFDNDIVAVDFVLGDNVRYNLEYFIDKGFYWSVGLRSRYNTFKKSIDSNLILDDFEIDATDINKIGVRLQDQTNQFYLQTQFRKDFALSVGAEHKYLNIKSETLNTSLINDKIRVDNNFYSLFSSLKLDTYNNKYFPKKGIYFNSDIHMYLFASHFDNKFDKFSICKADLGYAFSMSDKLAINVEFGGGFKFGNKATKALDFSLGGYGNNFINNFIPFIGYDFISITANSYSKGAANIDYEIFKKQHLSIEANWANVENDIYETGGWINLPEYSGYGTGYAIETLVGPIQLKYSYSPEHKRSVWYFYFGFWF